MLGYEDNDDVDMNEVIMWDDGWFLSVAANDVMTVTFSQPRVTT